MSLGSGYTNERILAELEARGIDGYVRLGREGKIPTKWGDPETWGIAQKLATEAGRATYATRKWISEASHGWIKEALEFRRFASGATARCTGNGIWRVWP